MATARPEPVALQAAFPLSDSPWFPVRDGDARLRPIYNRHYSSRGGDSPLIVGPGEKLCLLTPEADALFVWRRIAWDMRGEDGVNCAVFRNEGRRRSSDLIRAAVEVARERWPGSRLYTYVDPAAIASTNPGYCFKAAGWRACGRTPGGHGRRPLVVLEYADQ